MAALAFIGLVILAACALLYTAVQHNRQHLRTRGIAPDELSVINQQSLRIELYPRDGDLGRKLLPLAYGHYADAVKTMKDPISIGVEAEFVLPHFQVDGIGYLLRESPTLRYRLVAARKPDLVLLGSSIFFQGFNREEFYRYHPDKALVDFTMGNNRPAISLYLLEKARDLGLTFASGSVVLYGINEFELVADYGGSWQYVKDSVEFELGTMSLPKRVSMWLLRTIGMRALRDDFSATLKQYFDQTIALLFLASQPTATPISAASQPSTAALEAPPSCARREFNTYAVYNFIIPKDCVSTVEKLTQYLMAQIPAGLTILTVPYSQKQIDNLKKINDIVQEMGGKLVIIRLPTSDYVTARSPSYRHHFNDRIAGVINETKVPYFDASSHRALGITDMDYVWSHNRFDPEHLNFEGSRIFTKYILQHVYEPAIRGADRAVKPGAGSNQ